MVGLLNPPNGSSRYPAELPALSNDENGDDSAAADSAWWWCWWFDRPVPKPVDCLLLLLFSNWWWLLLLLFCNNVFDPPPPPPHLLLFTFKSSVNFPSLNKKRKKSIKNKFDKWLFFFFFVFVKRQQKWKKTWFISVSICQKVEKYNFFSLGDLSLSLARTLSNSLALWKKNIKSTKNNKQSKRCERAREKTKTYCEREWVELWKQVEMSCFFFFSFPRSDTRSE